MHFDLVYQSGIANVFRDHDDAPSARVMQGTFNACEYFARGALAAGATLDVWNVNAAGDIAACRDEWRRGTGGPFASEQHPPSDGWRPSVSGSGA